MVKSADTADLKSADPKGSWGFKSPSGHQDMLPPHIAKESETPLQSVFLACAEVFDLLFTCKPMIPEAGVHVSTLSDPLLFGDYPGGHECPCVPVGQS